MVKGARQVSMPVVKITGLVKVAHFLLKLFPHYGCRPGMSHRGRCRTSKRPAGITWSSLLSCPLRFRFSGPRIRVWISRVCSRGADGDRPLCSVRYYGCVLLQIATGLLVTRAGPEPASRCASDEARLHDEVQPSIVLMIPRNGAKCKSLFDYSSRHQGGVVGAWKGRRTGGEWARERRAREGLRSWARRVPGGPTRL